MPDQPAPARSRDVLQPTTPEVVAEARALAAAQTHAALATLDPADGHPIASRVNLAFIAGTTPLIFVSALSPHTAALHADPRCSLLLGDPGKGDPLAHPRLTLRCRAQEIGRGALEFAATAETWLADHPKAKLYIDLPDFRFFALSVDRVNYVASFGRAYLIDGASWQ